MKALNTLCALVAAALIAGCGSSVTLDESKGAGVVNRTAGDAASASRGAGGTAGGAGQGGRQITPVTAESKDPLNDPSGVLAKRSIYFDFDSFVIRDEFRPVIEAHARYLSQNRGRRVAIQGNTDERGSREYNLALGQKRAEAVRRALAILGVSDAQMEAVSFGEERPRATGADDAAYAENRRADIAYQ